MKTLVFMLFSFAVSLCQAEIQKIESVDDGWDVATADQLPFEQATLQLLMESIENKYKNIHAILVERQGTILLEQYYSGQDEAWGVPTGLVHFSINRYHDLRSISKSVTSILLGIALKESFESALSQPLLDFLPHREDLLVGNSKRVTLGHVLEMTAGFEWNEMTVPYSNSDNDEIRLYNTSDPIGLVLKRNLIEAPGTSWYYNGGLTMVIAEVIRELTNKPLLDFARESLFEPLGVSEFIWLDVPLWRYAQLPSAASGLRMRPRDLLRIGSVMANGGRWKGQQIVSEEWVRLMGQRISEDVEPWDNDGIYGYGLMWWHGQFPVGEKVFETVVGMGYGGQRLFIVPEKNLSVLIHAGNYGTGGPETWWQSERIYTKLMEAIKD